MHHRHRIGTDTMITPQHLLERLERIARSLEDSGHALALIGLGSVGRERDRLDRYSDLDFFAIVEDGHKARYIDDLSWLTGIAPAAFFFRNTKDGYKLLYEDGVFCEFAVFELDELKTVAFSEGRIVWRRPSVDEAICRPVVPYPSPDVSTDFLLGEALTNLLVGLSRHHRGEKLSASRFIQHYAVDRVVALAPAIGEERPGARDPFVNERRFEERFPGIAAELPAFIQGYDHNIESAAAILAFLERHFQVDAAMAGAIRALLTHTTDTQ